jgi:hypothetical protein
MANADCKARFYLLVLNSLGSGSNLSPLHKLVAAAAGDYLG